VPPWPQRRTATADDCDSDQNSVYIDRLNIAVSAPILPFPVVRRCRNHLARLLELAVIENPSVWSLIIPVSAAISPFRLSVVIVAIAYLCFLIFVSLHLMSYCNFVSAHDKGRCKCTFSALPSCSYLFLHLLLPNIVILNEINGDGDNLRTFF